MICVWYGTIPSIKMKILPKCLHVFQSLPLTVPQNLLYKIPHIIINNKYIWNGSTPRIKVSKFCQRVKTGGLAFPIVVIR